MKRNACWPLLNGTSGNCRVIIKLRNCQSHFHEREIKIEKLFAKISLIPWGTLKRQFRGISVNRLFTSLDDRQIIQLVKRASKFSPAYRDPNFFSYYAIGCPWGTDHEALLTRIIENDEVELAYIENDMSEPPSVLAKDELSKQQGYLNAAPRGINARYAWKRKGGDGAGKVKFIDIERGWLQHHEDLTIEWLPDTGLNEYDYRDHGAAVCGIIMMRDNEKGGVGITPRAKGAIISQWRSDGSFNTADAIMASAAHLHFGDIILLEAQTCRDDNNGKTWPIEIHDANFQAIRLASSCGITVIEAAGNGNLKSSIGYDLDNFEMGGERIFDPIQDGFRDSGALFVAAATSSLPHERICYSNYGKRINCFAWGENVVTTGSFPRSSGAAINSYTCKFGGTSSASAIITGVAIALQSMVEAKYKRRLSSEQMRRILSDKRYGTNSENGHQVDKIGVMPDLKKIIDRLLDDPVLLFGEDELIFKKVKSKSNFGYRLQSAG